MTYAVGGDSPADVVQSAGAEDTASTVFEIEYDAAPDAPTPGPTPTAAPEAPPLDPVQDRIAQIERANAATRAELAPLLAHLQAQAAAQQHAPPPIDPSRIDYDPNIKPSDLLALIDWKLQNGQQEALARSQYAARALLSEQQARGQYSPQSMGDGNDYDSMVSRYVAPLVAQNPYVEQLIQNVFPDDPATGRMYVATVIAAIEAANGDLQQGLRNVLASRAAYQQGADATRKAVSEAARVAAARVQPAGRSSATLNAGRKVLKTADDVWAMKTSDFDKFWNQAGRSSATH